ncbi:hypothetical protein ACHAXR_010829, partial [Thalassiosira sp. AJA248-18]
MTITLAEGKQLATEFMSQFSKGFAHNNHEEIMKNLFADEMSWSWSDGTIGEGSKAEFMEIVKGGWGGIIDSFIFCKPLTCVDTDNSRIVISSEDVFNITGGGLVLSNSVMVLKLNNDKQVVRWSGVWDPNNKMLLDAVAKVEKQLGKEMPKPKPTMPITLEEGHAFADAILKTATDGFAKNNHAAICTDLFADNLSWDWSDGTKGKGSYDDIMQIIAGGWGFMLESFVIPEPTVVVDTNRSIVAMSMPIVSNVTGGLRDENNAVLNNVTYVCHLNEDKKCFKWHICWDNNNPDLKAAVAKVMQKLNATSKISDGVAAASSMTGLATG